MNHSPIKLVIADDHPVVLHGLINLLTSEPDFEILAAVGDGAAALEAIFDHAPDIALLDLRLPKMTGLEVQDMIACGNVSTRVVIMTAFTEDREVLLAVSRGVHGIILKDSVADAVVQCLRRVRTGERCLPSELVQKELHRQKEAAALAQSLTVRERDVLRLVAKGLSNKSVADQLKICEGTLKLHLHHIYRKTAVRSRSGLIALAGKLDGEFGRESFRSDVGNTNLPTLDSSTFGSDRLSDA
jgi:DNA-binding NarL/FixJ family response regulator